MDKFLKRKSVSELPSPSLQNNEGGQLDPISKPIHVDYDMSNLPTDPGSRPRISDYHPNDQDIIRRAYLQRGPCQPKNHKFPQKKMGGGMRRFNVAWFDQHKDWLEYSIEKDAAFCLHCYLFKPNFGDQSGGNTFVVEGFDNWKKPDKLQGHLGKTHYEAYTMSQNLMKQKQHIQTFFVKQSDQAKLEYRTRLNASIDCIRFLLHQGLAFRGHDESEDSKNRGNFLELLEYTANHNEDIKKVVLKYAPENHKLISPKVQKDITKAVAIKTSDVILEDLGDALFAVLVDESRDFSIKEQMAVVLRFVDKKGCVIERFLGITHVSNTTAISLKKALGKILSKYNLSITRLRGQGYDGASNMQGEFNGLKALIMKENQSAFYVHCFAHQLQLTLVHVAKNHPRIALFFNLISTAVNIVGVSCKRKDILRDKQTIDLIEKLNSGELSTGKGLNQETTLTRAGDTRWGSHYTTIIRLILMFSSVIDVLEIVVGDGTSSEQRGEAYALLESMQCFDFILILHMMKDVLGITNELSKSLQKKDQDIVNAINLVEISKQRFQMMRENEWDSLIADVSSFCGKHNITVPRMDDDFVPRGRSRRRQEVVTNLHHYRAELFYTCIDMQLQELNNRFDEVNTELLLCMTCLSPNNSFSAFDHQKLIRLAQFYPMDFSNFDLMVLQDQLKTYIMDVRSNSEFSNIIGIGGLAKKMVETKKDVVYPMVYLLITLSLILPVATATVERAFSAMHIVKSRLRNRMGDDWMNDCLVTYIERDVLDSIENEAIMQQFQNMRSRRVDL